MGAFQCRLALASACLCVFTLLRSLRHCCERSRARLARPPLPNCSAPSCAPSGPKASRAAHHKQFEVTLPSALSPCACQGHSARSVDWVAPGGSEVERRASTANARTRFPSPPPWPPPPTPPLQGRSQKWMPKKGTKGCSAEAVQIVCPAIGHALARRAHVMAGARGEGGGAGCGGGGIKGCGHSDAGAVPGWARGRISPQRRFERVRSGLGCHRRGAWGATCASGPIARTRDKYRPGSVRNCGCQNGPTLRSRLSGLRRSPEMRMGTQRAHSRWMWT